MWLPPAAGAWFAAAAALALSAPLEACGRRLEPPAGATLAAAAADGGPAFPVTLRDDRGVPVTVTSEPRRIVALLPSHTETLVALGVGARVVGVDDFSDQPAGAPVVPRLGGLYDVHVEELMSLRPDLVLASESCSAAPRLEQGGLAVWGGSARTFDDVFRVIRAVGALVGRSDEAARLAGRIARDVDDVEGRVRGLGRVRVYYELDSALYSAGPASFIGVLLAKAGGQNIVPPELGEFPQLSAEAVITSNPTVILGVSLDEAAARPGWGAIDAVRQGRVYRLPRAESALVNRPGPRIADGLRALARRLHPEAEP